MTLTLQRKTKSEFLYFIAPLLTVLVLLFVYYQKGVYPFGGDTVFSCDFGQAEFPYYIHVYDVFHGNGSFFYDLTSAGGIEYNMVCRLFDPFMWILFFVPRAFLGNFMSYFFVIYFFVICCLSQFAIRKIFNELPWYWVAVFSLVYTLSGYNLQYYTNSEWLIIVALFPLLALYCMKMLDGGKVYPFVIVLAFCLIVNTYISALTLAVMLIICSLYIFLMLDKKKRGNAALKLGTGVVCSTGISAFAVIPWLYTTFFSQRFSSTISNDNGFVEVYKNVLTSGNITSVNKVFMLLGLEFCFATMLMLLFKFKKDKKRVTFFVLSAISLVPQILLESINLLLHGGSYQLFPVRNGFIMVFMCICASCYYIEKYDSERNSEYRFKYTRLVLPAILLMLVVFVLPQYILLKDTASQYTSIIYSSNNAISKSVIYIALNALVYTTITFIAFYLNKNRIMRNGMCIALVLILLFLSTSTLFCSGDSNTPVTSDESYIADSFQLHDSVASNDIFSRICNEDVSLSTNYPYIVNRSSISNWHHTLSKEQRNIYKQLGFGLVYTRTLDTGGTAFSKALLCVDNTVSKRTLNNELYTLDNTIGDFNYYSDNYAIPFGVLFDEDVENIKYNADSFEFQNGIYKSIGYSDNLFSKADATMVSSDIEIGKDEITLSETKKYIYTYSVNVSEKSELYFQLMDGTDILNSYYSFNDCTVKVNGNDYLIPTNNDANNLYYRAMFNNNILDFGTFENETVTVTFSCNKELNGCFDMYVMNLQKMSDLSSLQSAVSDYSVNNKTNQINITASASDDGKLLFIPLYNNNGWVCTVNGEQREIKTVLDGFIAVKLDSGENVVTLKYNSRLSEYSIIASIIFTAVLLLLWAVCKNKKVNLKFFETTSLFAVALLFSLMIILVYLIPIGYYIYSLFV